MLTASSRLSRALAGAAVALLAATASAVSGGAAAPGAATASSPAVPSSAILPFCAPARQGQKTCLGLKVAPSARSRTSARSGSRPLVQGGPSGGFGPRDVQSAYGLAQAAASGGAAQTIGIVDAFSDPSAASDLATYRSHYSLPTCALGSASTSCLRIVSQTGTASLPLPDPGWASEITLDLDAASAACPLCHIVLVEATSAGDQDLVAAINTAVSLGATVLSLSFGGCEAGGGSNLFDPALQSASIPITVATGDSGYYSADNSANPGCAVGTPNYPASSPFVTAVGGTSLTATSSGRGWSETAWSYANATTDSGGGSGCSSFEPKPAWQTDGGCTRRTVSDVSADADPFTGLAVYNSYSDSGWTYYGGTSLAAPLIAGTVALANSPTTAVTGKIWYTTAPVNDVTSGSNAPSAADCAPAYLCNAGAGYDGPTGVGTPNGPPTIQATLQALPATQSSTAVPVSWTVPQGSRATSYTLWAQDTTSGSGRWMSAGSTGAMSTTFFGFRGHSYGFALQYSTANGWSSSVPTLASANTAILSNATLAMNYTAMYAVDGYGNLHPASSPPLASTAAWPGWDIARGLTASPSGQGGLVVDGWGNLHTFGDSLAPTATSNWPGWDIARGVTALPAAPTSTHWTGYVLDGYGGLQPFSAGGGAMAPRPTVTAYWSGWDIARGVATFANGTGGVVLDGFGGIHPYTVGANPMPGTATVSAYWSGWNIARSVALLPTSTAAGYSGYVLDGFGGLHPFWGGNAARPPAIPSNGFYWSGWDIARSVIMVPGSATDGYVVDGYGGFHFFGASQPASPLVMPNYGANAPLVRGAEAA